MAQAQPGVWHSQFNWMFATLGFLVSVVALISLAQRIGNIDLASIPEQYLGYYRSLMDRAFGWIELPNGWRVPQWYADLFAINLFTAGNLQRAATTLSARATVFSALILACTVTLCIAVVWYIARLLFIEHRLRSQLRSGVFSPIPMANIALPSGDRPVSQIPGDLPHDDARGAKRRLDYIVSLRNRFLVFTLLSFAATVAFFVLNASII